MHKNVDLDVNKERERLTIGDSLDIDSKAEI